MVTVSQTNAFPWTTTNATNLSLKESAAIHVDTTDWTKNHMVDIEISLI